MPRICILQQNCPLPAEITLSIHAVLRINGLQLLMLKGATELWRNKETAKEAQCRIQLVRLNLEGKASLQHRRHCIVLTSMCFDVLRKSGTPRLQSSVQHHVLAEVCQA